MGGTISTLACEVILYLSTAAAAEFLRHFDVTKFDRSKFFCHIAFFCTFCIGNQKRHTKQNDIHTHFGQTRIQKFQFNNLKKENKNLI